TARLEQQLVEFGSGRTAGERDGGQGASQEIIGVRAKQQGHSATGAVDVGVEFKVFEVVLSYVRLELVSVCGARVEGKEAMQGAGDGARFKDEADWAKNVAVSGVATSSGTVGGPAVEEVNEALLKNR